METGSKPNPIAAATAALKSGADIEQAVYGTPGNSASELGNSSPVSEEKPEIQVLENDGQTESSVEVSVEENSPSDSTVKVSADEKPAKQAKAPVDDKLKQYEKGMRKFQAERDAIKKEREALAKEYNELKSHWSSLEQAYANEGLAGVLNTIAGDPKAYEQHLQREMEKRKAREEATPAQRERMDLEERLQRLEQEKSRQEKRAKELEEKFTTERQVAEQKELQSVVNPLFDKYRFTGKLGDEESEYYYDKALWKETMDNLDKLPEETITRETIENEFKKVSSAFRKVISKQADTKVKKVIENKKQAAQESAAVKAMSGMQTSAATDEFRKNIRSGNIQDAFKQLISGKIKLS